MAAPPTPAGSSPATSRRLVAVWFADIVGYSSLASRDETAALQQVHNFQTACREAVLPQGGRLVKFLGDGAFAEFPSTEAAVRAAQSLCEIFSGEGGLLRIGVHVGDVVARADGDLYGDGVNTASRLQVEARPGQILVSGDVWRQLRSVPGLEFQQIGRKELRGIKHPIELFVVAGPGAESAEAGGGVIRFARELRRRYVFRAGLMYLIAAWVVIQVAVAVAEPLGLPEWTATLVIVLATLGFPIALVLAWAFEITPEGIVRTSQRPVKNPEPREQPVQDRSLVIPNRPATPGLAATSSGLVGFPRDVTPFVGREHEAAEVLRLVTGGQSRVVTITGTGGIGKTRLAMHVAAQAQESYPDGIYFVPLAGTASTAALLPVVGERLGFPLAAAADPTVQLVDFLRKKRILLVLDNFEQLAGSAGSLAPLLEESEGLRLLVTSRERLNLRTETTFPIAGLPLPSAHSEEGGDAVALFLQSARRFRPGFEPTEQDRRAILRLCREVEGVPLAIELAAAWIRVLSCEEIADEVDRDLRFLAGDLKDVPERHRSLGAVFDSAWKFLEDSERRAFRRISIFREGFTRGDADAVAGIDFTLLSNLVDRSLLRRGEGGRFEMLQVLQQFASDKLAEDAHENGWLAEQHALHFIESLVVARQNAEAADDADRWRGVEGCLPNVRAAWEWAVSQRRIELLQDGLDGLFEFFDARGRVREGAELLMEASEALEEFGGEDLSGGALLLSRLRVRTGVFAGHMGRHQEAENAIGLALSEFGRLGDRGEMAFALEKLGGVAHRRGDYEAARTHLEASRQIYSEISSPRGLGRSNTYLGNLAYSAGDFEEAERLYGESIELLRRAGYTGLMGWPLLNLAVIASTRGAHDDAKRLFQESAMIARDKKDQRLLSNAMFNLGATEMLAGQLADAEEHLNEAASISRELGFRRLGTACDHLLGKVDLASGRRDEALRHCREALVTAWELDDRPRALDILITVAEAVQESDPDRALEVLALVLSNPAGDFSTRSEAVQLVEQLTGRLSPDLADRAFEQGRSSTLEEVVRQLATPDSSPILTSSNTNVS